MSAADPFSASAAVASAFNDWRLAFLAAEYVAPCPGDVMDRLTASICKAETALGAVQSAGAGDILMKMFPLFVANYPPHSSAPFLPDFSSGTSAERELFASILADFARFAPDIFEATQAPGTGLQQRRQA